MSRPRVFITRRIPQVGLDLIGAVCDVDLWDEPLPPGRDELLKRIAGCDGVLTMLSEKVDDEFFDAAGEQLKVVSQYAVGFNNIDVDAAKSRNIAVGNTPGALTAATADLGFALLIAAARRLVEAHEYIHADKWKTWEPLGHIGWDLEGKPSASSAWGESGRHLLNAATAGGA